MAQATGSHQPLAGTVPEELLRTWLTEALRLPAGGTPFPWQLRLLDRFLDGTTPRSLDIPTGLGKTATMAVWLVARLGGAAVPTRLVYVVDRRAVVDQASRVAEELRDWLKANPELADRLGLEGRTLPISTLRGRFVDNREWLADPSCPAIVVGTVDMIGSRLLFEGYGVSRRMRPIHAAMLGCDALLVLDEAHLVPPFERLIEQITSDRRYWPWGQGDGRFVRPTRLLSLSATGTTNDQTSLSLDADDRLHRVVATRLAARKRLRIEDPISAKLAEDLAARAWDLGSGRPPARYVIFCDRPTVAEEARALLLATAKRAKAEEPDTELFVGGRRIAEREQAESWLQKYGYLPGGQDSVPLERSCFLFATSAAEVGVDLDADHMVCDLVSWDRMVQRLGRVNRRGGREAEVVVVLGDDEPKKKTRGKKKGDSQVDPEEGIKNACLAALRSLPAVDQGYDASLHGLHELESQAAEDPVLADLLQKARTPAPLYPALSLPLLEAWAMTSLEEHSGRPEVAPWLRGWIDEEPQTVVLWRKHLPIVEDATTEAEASEGIDRFFEAAPPHTYELLETETFKVVDWLTGLVFSQNKKRTDEESTTWQDDPFAIVLDGSGEFVALLRPRQLLGADRRRKDELARVLRGKTLVVRADFGGLKDGRLDAGVTESAVAFDALGTTIDQTDTAVPFLVRLSQTEDDVATAPSPLWKEELRFPIESDDRGVIRSLVVLRRRERANSEEGRATGNEQQLDEHQRWVEESAREIAGRLGLPPAYREMLAVAARLHDEGKGAAIWQKAFHAPGDEVYAKTRGPVNFKLLDGYRHEFGSLLRMEREPALRELEPELRDLAMHLVVAHHGFARPIISTRNCEDAPPSMLAERAREVALRFLELQRSWGPWGLAWWETLLRCADQEASRRNDETPGRGGAHDS